MVAGSRDRARLHRPRRLGAGAARLDLLALDRCGRGDGAGLRAVPRHGRPGSPGDRGPARARRERLAARTALPRGAARLRRLPRQDDGAVPPAERGRRARPRHVRGRIGVHRARAHAVRGPSADPRDRRPPGSARLRRAPARRPGRRDRRRPARGDLVHPPRDALLGADPELRKPRGDGERAGLRERRARRAGAAGSGPGLPELRRRRPGVVAHGVLRQRVRRPRGAQARARPLRPAALPAGDRVVVAARLGSDPNRACTVGVRPQPCSGYERSRSAGKRITSRIDLRSHTSIARRSIPRPRPAVGGRP